MWGKLIQIGLGMALNSFAKEQASKGNKRSSKSGGGMASGSGPSFGGKGKKRCGGAFGGKSKRGKKGPF